MPASYADSLDRTPELGNRGVNGTDGGGMRLIIDLSQSPQGRLEGSITHPVTAATITFEGVIELVGVLEQHLRAETETAPTASLDLNSPDPR